MATENNKLELNKIQNQIFAIRNIQVMIDRDLAEIYGVEVKRLNEQVKRNLDRFPSEFRFQLNKSEKEELVANCDRFEKLKHSSVNPYAFTEQGVAMLSAVLHSETAVKVSIQVMKAFVEMKKFLSTNAGIFQRLDKVEFKQVETEQKFDQIFKALENNSIKPMNGVFYDGQVFDAYVFVSELIKSAKSSIVLIDNYVDESVLSLLSKREKEVSAVIYTSNISKQLRLDLKKHNEQYATIEINTFKKSHDRFLIIDHTTVYHIGASLKDLGKKWFAFSKISLDPDEMLLKLK